MTIKGIYNINIDNYKIKLIEKIIKSNKIILKYLSYYFTVWSTPMNPAKKPEAEPAIELSGLCKEYRQDKSRVTVLKDLNLCVNRSEIFGFLGPNGAGKTTTIKSILSLVTPDKGEIRIAGVSNQTPNIREKIGFLPETSCFSEYLTARETLMVFSRLSDMKITSETVDSVLSEVHLLEHSNRLVKNFSKGMKQRLGLAQAILHNPDILILDEPLSGLDPLGRKMMKEIILRQKKAGKTVFLSSHQLLETEQICDRAAIICNGKIVKVITMNDLEITDKETSELEKVFIETLQTFNIE
jgi:ABC-2 type transport system ATP-binding protein